METPVCLSQVNNIQILLAFNGMDKLPARKPQVSQVFS